MAFLNGDSVKSFEFLHFGQPYIRFETNTNANTLDGGYTDGRKGFFVGASGSVATISTNNVYVKTGTGWTNVQEIYVNVSGNWKRVVNDNFFVKQLSGQWAD